MPIPVSLDDAKRQLKIEIDDASQDDEIRGFIDDAAAWIEKLTGHVLVAREVVATFDAFDGVSFREWPIARTAVPTVSYEGSAGQAVPVVGVRAVLSRRPVRIAAAIGGRWPLLPTGSAITATIRAGYEDGDEVPPIFRRAILLLVAAYDADREGGDIVRKAEEAAKDLCGDYRIRVL